MELTRFLDPGVLAGISNLELVAKTVVDGFVAGMHRSPDFGFSQEFAEYRAYTPGDDLRHVDWNVFARTERCYLKRYRGETNTQLTVLLDASSSMAYSSQAVSKLDYARYLAASLAYMAQQQRDASGLVVFDVDVRHYVQPSSRQGQLSRLLHAINQAEAAGSRTDLSRPFLHCQEFLHRRGIVVAISDFYEQPEAVIRAMQPLRYHGSDLMMFHILDPREMDPHLKNPVLMVDMETGDSLEVSPEFANTEYRQRIASHVERLATLARAENIDYLCLRTDRPLDAGLREYFLLRQRRM